jgi:ATP adenylyltransferase
MPVALFAPWRYEYLVAAKPAGCIFCEAALSADPKASLIVHRGRKVFVILNRYPYTNGHVMVAPYAHEAWLSDSAEETLHELVATVARAEKILVNAYRTDGLNVGINFGAAAGAGVAGHYHVHVVPRWSGDTNFMPVIARTSVLPEALGDIAAKLRAALAR